MTMPRRLLLTFALAAVLLATSAVGSTEALPRKPRERSLAEGLPSGASKPGATSNHWIDSPVTFSAGGPPIYGCAPMTRLSSTTPLPVQYAVEAQSTSSMCVSTPCESQKIRQAKSEAPRVRRNFRIATVGTMQLRAARPFSPCAQADAKRTQGSERWSARNVRGKL